MASFFLRWALVLVLGTGMSGEVLGFGVELPFGLKWGDAPGGLIDWAVGREYEVQISLPANEPNLRIVTIRAAEGELLDGTQLNEASVRFLHGRLIEVTLTLDQTGLTATTIKTRFIQMRKLLSAKYGAFKVNRRSSTSRNDFAVSSISYHVEPLPGLFVLIAHTEVEDQLRQVRDGRYSLIFRNHNLQEQLEEKR